MFSWTCNMPFLWSERLAFQCTLSYKKCKPELSRWLLAKRGTIDRTTICIQANSTANIYHSSSGATYLPICPKLRRVSQSPKTDTTKTARIRVAPMPPRPRPRRDTVPRHDAVRCGTVQKTFKMKIKEMTLKHQWLTPWRKLTVGGWCSDVFFIFAVRFAYLWNTLSR